MSVTFRDFLLSCLFIFLFIVQVVNFKLIPVAQQLNFCLAFSLVWATILSVIRSPDVTSSSKSEDSEPADIIPLSNCSVEIAQRWPGRPSTTKDIWYLPRPFQTLKWNLETAQEVTYSENTEIIERLPRRHGGNLGQRRMWSARCTFQSKEINQRCTCL